MEKKYIESNTFTHGMMSRFYPFSFEEDGKVDGYSYDYINLIIKKSGLKIDIVLSNSWNDSFKKFKTKQLDLIDGISYKKNREFFTNFSQPYYETSHHLFNRKGEINNFTGLESLKGKKVGIINGIYYYDTLKDLQLFELIAFENTNDNIKALISGKVDVVIDNIIVAQQYIKKSGYLNIKILGELDTKIIKKDDLRIGVKKEDKVLFSIINKSINAITTK